MNDEKLCYSIYLQAKRFEDSAELLFKEGNSNPDKFYIPAWSLAAFSLELYLKSIQQHEKGKFLRTHVIKDIFHELNEESKNKIKTNFKFDLLQIPDLNVNKLELISGVKITENFDEVLNDISNLFVEFRYIFDDQNKPKSFVYIESLRKAITDRVSELEIDKNPKLDGRL